MPQFDLANWLPQIVWLILTFGAMYLVVRAALPKVEAVKVSRAKVISDDLGGAETAKSGAQSAAASIESTLGLARGTATKLTTDTKAQAATDAAGRLKVVDAELALKADAALTQLTATQAKSLQSLEAVAVDVSAELVERLIGHRPEAAAAAAAVARVAA